MKNSKPVIGVTCSYVKNETTDHTSLAHTYPDAIRHFGGIPLLLPVEGNSDEYQTLISFCDGILLTGGNDIDPALYGEEKWNDTVEITPIRDKNEFLICDLASAKKLPMLGICRGIQTMNVYFGGTLYQDIPTQLATNIKHHMEPPYHRGSHNCILSGDTPMRELLGEDVIMVNSHHHQAVKKAAPGFLAAGCCEDGVIEAICNPDEKFIWGVQWHPERIWDIEASSAKVFEAFLAACRR